MKTYALIALLALGAVAQADSELDGKAKAPAVIVSQLNPVTQTVTNYQVPSPTAQMSPDALDKLTDAERNARVQGFLKQVVRPENKISEEKAQQANSELDGQGSTSSTYWRWRGYRGNYYGASFNLYYGNYSYYYYPRWTYANYYYNRGGYYNYYYPRYYGYNDCYYTTYNYDGYYWN